MPSTPEEEGSACKNSDLTREKNFVPRFHPQKHERDMLACDSWDSWGTPPPKHNHLTPSTTRATCSHLVPLFFGQETLLSKMVHHSYPQQVVSFFAKLRFWTRPPWAASRHSRLDPGSVALNHKTTKAKELHAGLGQLQEGRGRTSVRSLVVQESLQTEQHSSMGENAHNSSSRHRSRVFTNRIKRFVHRSRWLLQFLWVFRRHLKKTFGQRRRKFIEISPARRLGSRLPASSASLLKSPMPLHCRRPLPPNKLCGTLGHKKRRWSARKNKCFLCALWH